MVFRKIERRVFKHFVFVCLIIALDGTTSVVENISDQIRRCCHDGQRFGHSNFYCSDIKSRVDMKAPWIGLCYSTYSFCCKHEIQTQQCNAGQLAALSGSDCQHQQMDVAPAYMDCCQLCKIALAVKALNISCDYHFFSYFSNTASYQLCCLINNNKSWPSNEIKNLNENIHKSTVEINSHDFINMSNSSILNGYDDDVCRKFRLCQHICENTKESYFCKCYDGYKLNDDMVTCSFRGKKNSANRWRTVENRPETKLHVNRQRTKSIQTIYSPDKDENEAKIVSVANAISEDSKSKTYPKHNQSKCNQGFYPNHGLCIDIDECRMEEIICDSNQICLNNIGSYHCDCKIGYNLDIVVNACIDINECSFNNHSCLPTQRCDNTVGSYRCTRLQSCGTGYTLNADSDTCVDNDECILQTHNCKEGWECHNTKGSFRCYRAVPHENNSSILNITDIFQTRNDDTDLNYIRDATLNLCLKGFYKNHLGACVDINECSQSNACRPHEICINTNGSYNCQNALHCPSGYEAIINGTTCLDINECENGYHNCAFNQICLNTIGSFICKCQTGYRLQATSDTHSVCEDINECRNTSSLCPLNAHCINTIGSYDCECKSGFSKSKANSHNCLDINECNEIPDLCQQKCVNFYGGYQCICDNGYELGVDNRTCFDVNECEDQRSFKLCMGFCNNVPGSYKCSCPRGYILENDQNTCQDIDECSSGKFCTGRYDVCTNTRGSYKCATIVCPRGYRNDPLEKTKCQNIEVCEGLECYNKPNTYTYNFISLISKLMVSNEGRTIFTLRGPLWYDIEYKVEIKKIQAAINIEKATYNYFSTLKVENEIRLILKHPLEGPQEIDMEIMMSAFVNGMLREKTVCKLYILVSKYQF